MSKTSNSQIINVLEDEFYSQISPTNIEPLEALKNIEDDRVFYFKNKEDTFELLAIGVYKDHLTHEEVSKLLGIRDENIYIVSNKSFYDRPLSPTNEWSDFSFGHYLPKYLIIKDNNSIREIHYSSDDEVKHIFKKKNTSISHNEIKDIKKHTSQETWQKKVNKALVELNKETIEKVVLSRKNEAIFNQPIDQLKYFLERKDLNQNSYQVYYFQKNKTFISFTPETLFKVKNGILEIDCLAGTIKKPSRELKDREREEFKNNKKEINEHRIVCQTIEAQLRELEIEVNYKYKERILSLRYVEHLHSLIYSKITKAAPLEILNKLHPTPAVGGRPRELALKIIQEIEEEDRGLYAAPIGVLNSSYTNYCVGIRSCLIKENQMFVYGGCGIVKESDAKKEWQEIKNKMKNFI